MAKYVVRLVYPSGTVKDVFQTNSKEEAEGYIKASKELRPRIRHQLGTKKTKPQEFGFVCHNSQVNYGCGSYL